MTGRARTSRRRGTSEALRCVFFECGSQSFPPVPGTCWNLVPRLPGIGNREPGTTHTEREAFPRLTYRSDNGLVAAFAVISLHGRVAWW